MNVPEEVLEKLKELRELLDDSAYIAIDIAPSKKNAFLASRFVLEDEDICDYIEALDVVLKAQ